MVRTDHGLGAVVSGEQAQQPVPLGVGPFREPAEIHVHALGAAHQGGEPGLAERGIGVAVGGGALHVRGQAGVRCGGRRPGVGRGIGRDARGQPADAAEQGGGHRRTQPVECGHGAVHGPWPPREMLKPGPVTFGGRSVVAVVAGQVETIQVRQRAASVQLQVAEGDPGALLERRQVRLVMRIIQRPAGGGLGQPAQALAHAVRRQILDGPVVLVPSAVLAHLSNVEVAHGPQPRGEVVHDPDVTGRHPPRADRPESRAGQSPGPVRVPARACPRPP